MRGRGVTRLRTPAAIARRRVVHAAAVVGVTAPVLLAAARWPLWWTEIAPEQTAMTWLQSVVLVVAATGAALLGLSRCGRTWYVLSAGLTGLAVDERFALHERLRDGVLAPRGVTVPFLPWVAAGDFLLLGCAVAGLAVLPRVIRVLRADRLALRALLVGVALAAVAVGADSIDPSTWTPAQERVQQTLEECVELASGLSLLTAVLLRLLGRLMPAGQGRSQGGQGRSNVATTGAWSDSGNLSSSANAADSSCSNSLWISEPR